MPTVANIPGCPEEKLLTIRSFCQNSLEVERGDVFFALPGKKVAGSSFLQEVAARGAVAAVVPKEYQGDNFGLFLFHSENVLLSLQELAKSSHEKNCRRVVGVTGSVGKTSTKEFLATLLEKKYRVGKSPGSKNSQTTLPLNLLNLQGDLLVLEMGMSEKGEIARLVEIAPPEIALITKIAPAHIANFPEGLLGIAKAKCEIFSHPTTRAVVVPYSLLDFVRPNKEFLTFSTENPKADFFLQPERENACFWEKGKRVALFPISLKERHFQEDFLAAAAVARWLGLSWEEIEERASFLQLPKMRFEKVVVGKVVLINDAYNANPDSMSAALESLPQAESGGRVIAVLGEMADQGSFSKKNHWDIGKKAAAVADLLFCLGEETRPLLNAFLEEGKKGEVFFEKQKLFSSLRQMVKKNDIVLIKGKRSLEMDEIFYWMVQEIKRENGDL